MTDVRIPSFVDGSHTYSYFLNDNGIIAAKKILCVLELSNPDIIHSPMLFSLISLFLHYMDVSKCYNCVYALLRAKECSFLTTTKVSYEASKLVIRDLAKKYAVSTPAYKKTQNIEKKGFNIAVTVSIVCVYYMYEY